MLSYIASNSTANLIKSICKQLNISILNEEVEELDFLKYIKETKVNFNLIKYLIIDLSQIKNTEDQIINSIKYFREIYLHTRVIVIAKGFDNQNIILTTLYDIGVYNLINDIEESNLQIELRKCLSNEGIQKNEAKKFKKQEEIKIKENKIKKLIDKVKIEKNKPKENKIVKEKSKSDMPINSVYLFSLLLEAITRLVKFICYVLVFVLTSIGLTILLNSQLRQLVFQIFGLK